VSISWANFNFWVNYPFKATQKTLMNSYMVGSWLVTWCV